MVNQDAYQVLGLEPDAGDEQIRAAYLALIQKYPPERCPEEFERVRDAYAELRDPRERMRKLIESTDTLVPLPSLLEGKKGARNHIGAKLWLGLLKQQ